MHDRQEFLKSYPAVVIGLVAVLMGAAGVGLFLSFAGDEVWEWAIIAAVVAVLMLGGGLGLLVVVFHRRGGLLRARVSREERAVYRAEYRRGEHEPDNDSSRTRRV